MLQAAIPPLALPTGDGDGSGEHVGDAQDAWARRYVELTPSAMLLYARASTESKFTRIQVWRWEDVALVAPAWGGNNRTHRASSNRGGVRRPSGKEPWYETTTQQKWHQRRCHFRRFVPAFPLEFLSLFALRLELA